MTQLQEILDLVRYPSEEKTDLITRAYTYAKNAHEGQKRYSGEPYFNHAVETAKLLAELGMGGRTISAGLLHDVMEDAGITEEELTKEFGKEITFLVEGVTKLGNIRYSKEQQHVESLRKFFVAMSQDIRVLVIKLADRLHNMRTLQFVPEEKRKRIALETMEIYVPLAYRLGMRKLKRELEDLAFKEIDPEHYEEILALVKRKRLSKNVRLEKIRKTLLKALAKAHVHNVETDMRQKSIYSIYTKLNRKQRGIDRIYDIDALRVNLDSIEDCYKTFGIIHSLWRPLPGRIKDYIAFPKPNGYQSLHTTVFIGEGTAVEIQIRTHEMHNIAEFGLASHMIYKAKGTKEKDPNLSWFQQFFPKHKRQPKKALVEIDEERVKHIPEWIKQLVDIQSYVSITADFIDNLKTDFFEHRMFIFDKSGEVIDLPIGSTALDFAYELDPDTANRFFGAKINGKFMPIDTKLSNGDIIAITTKKTPQVNDKWLSLCKTTHAKQLIVKALKK